MNRTRVVVASLCALALPIVWANDLWELPLDEPQLKPADGFELVSASCQTCHSIDYISTQPPLDRTGWSATIQKMREKYGAPIQTNQVNEILDYLVKAYGKK